MLSSIALGRPDYCPSSLELSQPNSATSKIEIHETLILLLMFKSKTVLSSMPSVQAWTLPHKGTCTSVMWSEVKNYRKKKETWFVKSRLVKTNKQRLLLSVKQSIWRFILHFNALCDNFSSDLLLFWCISTATGCQTAIKSPIRNILLYHLHLNL